MNRTYYRQRQRNNTNNTLHNSIACTEHLPTDARDYYAANTRRKTFKRGFAVSFHKLPAPFVAELMNRSADYVICDFCRKQASS